ncbi:MAG: cytochrome ubiquinol oxidase subunit I, partial [Ktedonobacterales bacterium]|nr:cytochrome ubiquinol oxidase subunit I [Ktedonobacterales bacterium]
MNLMYGRVLMGTSLGLHIILAVIGMALPLYISLAEGIGIWKKNDALRLLARRWTSAFVILFAVGAATGMIVGIELSLLWPNFMTVAGQAIALPFAVETFAFFFEAIFLGLYVYGWDRFKNPVLHWLCSLPIAISAAASGSLITIVNAWMNSPAGFTLKDGKVTNVQPIAAVLNPATPSELAHTVVTAYLAVGFMLAGITAVTMLRERRGVYYQQALTLTMLVALVAACGTIITGDLSGKYVAQYQPAKLAAMEALYQTQTSAPEIIGGVVDSAHHTVHGGIEIPFFLSFLATGDVHGKVVGLDDIAAAERPPIIIHYMFDAMVGAGMLMFTVAAAYALALWRRPRWATNTWMLRAIAISLPMGFLAIEAGWEVTE